ncbi:hypothetical protein H5410_037934 [Solanum commersonii]|uniref:Uncharacterized protein n=1 Tax=Solanum commersonii TaxID=4109 RepID=A0A9J5YCJ5_SOLCO|nr:hypothetical protein H5410_037934 [Solanum commersonii]
MEQLQRGQEPLFNHNSLEQTLQYTLLLLLLLISAVRFLKQSHQRLQFRRGIHAPVLTFRCQRCSEVHVPLMVPDYGLFFTE